MRLSGPPSPTYLFGSQGSTEAFTERGLMEGSAQPRATEDQVLPPKGHANLSANIVCSSGIHGFAKSPACWFIQMNARGDVNLAKV